MSPLFIAVAGVVVLLLAWVVIDRVLNPLLRRRTLRKLLNNANKRNPRALENPKHGTVLGDTERLKIQTRKGAVSELCWNDVEEVHA